MIETMITAWLAVLVGLVRARLEATPAIPWDDAMRRLVESQESEGDHSG